MPHSYQVAENSRRRPLGSGVWLAPRTTTDCAYPDWDRRDKPAATSFFARTKIMGMTTRLLRSAPDPAQSADASSASVAGTGGWDVPSGVEKVGGALAAAQMQDFAASGEVVRARASSMIRRMVRAQRPHSALQPKHR